jgi:transcriptional regulator
MYTPKHYEETDPQLLNDFIRQNNFGILVSLQNGLPVATHIPFTLLVNEQDGSRRLLGHISRANLQWKTFQESGTVLVIFGGPHAYISPRWYNHLNVPTWNYMAVHAYGPLRVVSKEAELRSLLNLLVDQHENGAYSMESLPEEMIEKQIRGIVAFEVAITQLQASFKLSQNRDKESYHNVIRELEGQDDTARQVAVAMQAKANSLFGKQG